MGKDFSTQYIVILPKEKFIYMSKVAGILFVLIFSIVLFNFVNINSKVSKKEGLHASVSNTLRLSKTPQTTQIENIFGHVTNQFALNDSTFFAEDYSQGRKIINSKDRGKTWQTVYSGSNKEIDDLLQDYVRSFYFINESHGWIAGKDATWETFDGGKTWSKLFQKEISQIFFTNQNNGWINVLVGEQQKQEKYKTSDGGRNWSICGQKTDALSITGEVYFTSVENGWSFTEKQKDRGKTYGIAITTDGGCQWKEIWNDFGNFYPRPADIYFLDEKNGWFSTSRGINGLLKTTDGGKTWNQITIPREQAEIETFFFKNELEGWILFASLPKNPILYRTYDGGENWVEDSKENFFNSYEKDVVFPRVSSGVRRAIVIQSILNN